MPFSFAVIWRIGNFGHRDLCPLDKPLYLFGSEGPGTSNHSAEKQFGIIQVLVQKNDKMLFRMFNTKVFQCLQNRCRQSERLAGRGKFPSRDRQETVVTEFAQVIGNGIDRVQVVFSQ